MNLGYNKIKIFLNYIQLPTTVSNAREMYGQVPLGIETATVNQMVIYFA